MIVESYFEDYREVDGIRLPFTVRVVSPTGTYSLRFSKVQHNIPIDDAKFSKPTAP